MLKNKRGIALIMSVGILAIMSIIATSFAINMRMEQEAALNYLRSVKAKYIAEAGINKAIADIRSQVKSKKYDDLISYVNSYSTQEQTIEDTGTYTLTIGKENTKVNLNALDETDYVWIDTLASKGLSYTDIAKIIDYRDSDSTAVSQLCTSIAPQSASGDETNAKNAPYVSLEEVKLVIGDTKYESIKDDITIFAPIVRGGLVGQYYQNMPDFDESTILSLSNYKGKVIELGRIRDLSLPGSDGKDSGWYESNDAAFAGGYLFDYKFGDQDNNGGWEQIGVVWTGFIYIPQDKVNQSITFYKRSDDGTKLFIDDDLLINDWIDRTEEAEPGTAASKTFKFGGWHPIRIEFYDQGGWNAYELRWNALDSIDYVPAEYFGYYPPSYLGPYPATTATETTYNSAGCYKITSTGKTKTKDDTILAEKKISAGVKVFGTWTQTTRAEFYAPWFSVYGDYSDGEISNVNWLDSCPTNAEGTSETLSANSLKLGYWDDCHEDVAYTLINLVVPWHEWQWQLFDDTDGDGKKEFRIEAGNERREVEINRNFYNIDFTNNNVYLRAWEKDLASPFQRKAFPWCVGFLYPMWKSSSDLYYSLLLDEWDYGPEAPYDGDRSPDSSEIVLNTGFDEFWQGKVWTEPYLQSKTMGVTSSGGSSSKLFEVYVDGHLTGAKKNRDTSGIATVALGNYNINEANPPVQIGTTTVYWNKIRMMSGVGTFVSTPFCTGTETGGDGVDWGMISWHENKPSGTDILLYGRVTNTTTDSNWSGPYSNSNGQALNLSKANWLQYKITMEDDNYNGITPVFQDVTITYLPSVEIFYWRTEMQ